MIWWLFFAFANAGMTPCDFNDHLEAWLQKLSVPINVQSCEILLDKDDYLNDVSVYLRGKHIFNRRADYTLKVESEKESKISLNLTFYYFKKNLAKDATQKKAKEIEKEILAYAKAANLEIEKTKNNYAVQAQGKSLEWESLLGFRLKPSSKVPDSRYKIHSLGFGIKIRLNRLEVYADLKTKENHPVFQFAKTYLTNGIHRLRSGKVPMLQTMGVEKQNSLMVDPLTQQLQGVMGEIHTKMEEI